MRERKKKRMERSSEPWRGGKVAIDEGKKKKKREGAVEEKQWKMRIRRARNVAKTWRERERGKKKKKEKKNTINHFGVTQFDGDRGPLGPTYKSPSPVPD